MKQFILILLLICFVSCINQSNPNKINQTQNNINTEYVWKKLLDNANWNKSYNFQMFSIKNSLWTFHHDGNWFSIDGVNWKKSTLTNAVFNQGFLDYVQLNENVFGLGHFEGNIEKFIFKPIIYKTTDFKKWEIVSTQSNLPQRFFYHPFTFKNKIWIIGGENKVKSFADIWNSDDGINWIKQRDSMPFGDRSNSQIVNLNGKLFLLNNDVWSSTDGLNWKKEIDEILKGEILFGYNALIYDNKIWLLGCNRNGQFTSQVLFSSDGKNWKPQSAPWSPRGGIAATVYKNKIYMTGGKYGGTTNEPEFIYSNDVWTLEKKK